eukprot:CAMPEP_0182444584 /NCGR_PEP_ID=MMETSP1172-20130603/2990_1 /TAXON_ID=708627 /ORGANISM="Timspurckia oligopyrenoides, Strain CCMP3278" /LENGTH=708 /DNA_ID=CAMNT_0024640179 /DNA_START=26 /DNA_END=2152 /DNA_ORIENTATION=+
MTDLDGASEESVDGAELINSDTLNGEVLKSEATVKDSQSRGDHHTAKLSGYAEKSNVHFEVPVTLSMADALLKPKNWGLAEIAVNCVMLCQILTLFLVRSLPTWFYIFQFFFWRIGYNVTLGLILQRQSKTQFITEWIRQIPDDTQVLLKNLIKSSYGTSYKWSKLPCEFHAWILFRMLAMMILANDGLSYFILTVKLFQHPSQTHPLLFVFCILTSAALAWFSAWSKTSAHRCVGDYAWYWGDFFFKIDTNLVFDGVFEMFPHPMYTVGYAAYYGASIFARSSTLLVLSLLAHSMQILFLVYIEEPHIQKVYGSEKTEDKSEESSKRETIPKEMLGLRHFDVFRPSDFVLVVMLCFVFVHTIVYDMGLVYYSSQLLAWRVFHFVVLSTVLHAQSTRNWWMNRLVSKGYSRADAFKFWQRLYNTSVVMNHASFLAFVIRKAVPKLKHAYASSTMWTSSSLASAAAGIALMCVSFYVVTSATQDLGDASWFYADFFLDKQDDLSKEQQLHSAPVYAGVYRYMNNPDCVLGFLGHYGLALLSRSWTVFWVALFSNLANYAFVHLVEVPHMQKKYDELSIRDAAALERAILHHVPIVRSVGDEIREKAVRGSEKLSRISSETAVSLTQKLDQLTADIQADIQRLMNDVQQHRFMLKTTALTESAAERMQNADTELLNVLRNSSLTKAYLEAYDSEPEETTESAENQHVKAD